MTAESRPASGASQVPTGEFVTESKPLSQRCHDCYEFGHEACGCGECGAAYCGRSDESPQAITYLEALLEGANPDEGFYE